MSQPKPAAAGLVHVFQAGLVEPGSDPLAPTLLLLHGTGGDENDLLPLGRALAPGCSLLSVRGNVRENGQARFFRRLSEGVFDLEDLAQRTAELTDFLRTAASIYKFELNRLLAVGFSNGANMAANLLLTSPDVLAGGILIRAMLPFAPANVPNLAGKSILLLNGQFDPVVPPAQPKELAAIFQSAGAEATLHWQPAGHNLAPADVAIATKWLANHFERAAKLNYT